MLSVNDIVNRVASNLNDPNFVFYTKNDIISSLQDGYDVTAAVAKCIEKTLPIGFLPNIIYYPLYYLINDFTRVNSIFNQDINRWMDLYDTRYLDAKRYDWESATGGSAYQATILNFNFVAFFSHYADTVPVNGFMLYYAAIGERLLPDTLPQIPDQFIRILESYATGDLLEQQQEYQKASVYNQDFEKLLGDLTQDVRRQSSPDFFPTY